VPTPSGLCGWRFDVFTEGEVIQTEDSYQSKDIAVFFREVSEEKSALSDRPLVYYVADIYVQNIEDLRSALSRGAIKTTEPMRGLAQSVDALIAIAGDFSAHRKTGLCVRDGITYRSTFDTALDVGVLTKDGVLEIYEAGAYTAEHIAAREPWQVWTFGPNLLDEGGKAQEKFDSAIARRNPRAVLGYYEPGHYCFVLVRGRVKASKGLTLAQLSQLMEQLGCVSAFNLDGGQTAQLYWDGKLYKASNSARQVNDIVYLPLAASSGQ